VISRSVITFARLRSRHHPSLFLTRFFCLLASLVVIVPTSISGQSKGNYTGQTARPLRYHPQGTDFVIANGKEFFNRPLYGTNTAFRVDAGDRPEFVLYLPGRGGNLRLGIKTARGQKWLFDAERVVTRYRPGGMLYEIRDPLLGSFELTLMVLPMSATEGLVLRAELQGAGTPVELVWAYGGANGERGRRDGDIGTEQVPMSEFFKLKPEFARGNSFSIDGSRFTLRSKPVTIIGLAPEGARLAIADANRWATLGDLLDSAGKQTELPLPLLLGQARLKAGEPLFLGLQRVSQTADDRGELDTYRAVRTEQTRQTNAPIVSLAPAYKIEELPRVFEDAERHRRALAGKVIADTPDPYINAAVGALSASGDSVWDEPQGVFMHGAVAWRSKLLGWRGPYVGDALGWHDRARRHFTYWSALQNTEPISNSPPPPDASVNFARNEPALHTNGDMSKSHYDMNVVYVDALFRHFLWTGDLAFARKVWAVIERHLAWERRLFRRPFGAEGLPLYEAYTVIWASDDLQYHGGGVTHSTAYNYYHNKMAAKMAKLLGTDATPYEREAELITRALRGELWLRDRGWFAEWKDLLGLQLAHPNPALWTFYHTVDSEVPTAFEAWQMSRFVDTQIEHIPVHGPGVPLGNYYTLPTTSWMPYTWSTNNVVMSEAAHTALAYWQAGRADAAFNLFKGVILNHMYMGLCPGNAGMTSYFDMARGEAQRDFADSAGVTARALIEGLFGIRPDALAHELLVQPGFPEDWNYANLQHSDFTIRFHRAQLTETYEVEPRFATPMKLRLRVPALRDGIAKVTVNGQKAPWRVIDDSAGLPRIEIESSVAERYKVVIRWKGDRPATVQVAPIVAKGGPVSVQISTGKLLEVADPQLAFGEVKRGSNSFRTVAIGTLGHRTAFAKLRQGEMSWWAPIMFEIRPGYELVPAENQDMDTLRFAFRNNTNEAVNHEASISAGGSQFNFRVRAPAFGDSEEFFLGATAIPPGSHRVVVEIEKGKTAEGLVVNWKLKGSTAKCDMVNLAPVFNDRVTQIFKNEYLSPRSRYVSLAIPKQGIGSWVHWDEKFEVDDAGLRAVADRNGGRFVLPQGIPFKTPGAGNEKNIAFTSQWHNYPREIIVPLNGKASHVYLLMAGSTNQMQSRFDNGEVVVTYTDGSSERLALHNPTTWWPIDQDYFIDDFAFRRPEPIPPRVDLRSGEVRTLFPSEFKGKGGKVSGGAATVLDLPMRGDKELQSLTVRTLANEVVIGLMAVTLKRD
jgi:hypothetical protein